MRPTGTIPNWIQMYVSCAWEIVLLALGIFVEGLGSFLDALFGTGNGTTSTSVNVGVVGITRVGGNNVERAS